jgi:lycopene cyclase domain-containing protein
MLVSIAVPFALSFEKNLMLYKRWKYLFPAIGLSMIPYLIWDVAFTKNGVWGFNPAYHGNVVILGLPLEEILFFAIIPYACVFTYYVFKFHFPRYTLSPKWTMIFSYISVVFALVFTFIYRDRIYTAVNLLFFAIVIYRANILNREMLGRFLLVFPVLCIPFVIVNGILTGTGIENEIVWYNNNEIIGWRLGTIPFEDFFYAFSLIVLNLLLLELFEKWDLKRKAK